MKVLFCGDIVGRAGRDVVIKEVPRLRRELGLDFVAVNGENAAAGFGITAKICTELHGAGVDCIPTGNHVWDQREIIPSIAQDQPLLLPLHFPPRTARFCAPLVPAAPGPLVIGMKKEIAVQRCLKKMPGERLSPAEGEGTLCAAVVETDDRSGLAKSVRPLRLGGRLPPTA